MAKYEWRLVAEKGAFAARDGAGALVFRERMWLLGGWNPGDKVHFPLICNSEVRSSADGASWTLENPHAPWEGRHTAGYAVHDGRMWILGGGTYDTPETPVRKFYNDVWSSDDGVNWERHTTHAPWAPRQYHEVAAFDDRMWVLEGWAAESGNRRDVWHSPDGVDWTELPDTPWAPRHAGSVFVFDGSLWMVAGNNMEPDVWRLSRRG